MLRPGTGALRALLGIVLLAGAVNSLGAVHYVDLNSTNAAPPYTNWATAATNIQDAVDAAVAGDEVVVTNGTYATGGRNGNRVEVDKPLNIRSVNGPNFTTIRGLARLGGRCVYLTNEASLSGFTLSGGQLGAYGYGGGAYGGTLTNCTLTGNLAGGGGGASGCNLENCTLNDNSASSGTVYGISAYGGGADHCTLNNCTVANNSARAYGDVPFGIPAGAYGGGTYDCRLNNCTLTGNSVGAGGIETHVSYLQGGGSYGGTLNNCMVVDNSANAGGGAYGGTLFNCTLNGNQAVYGGGMYGGTLNNCIAYANGYENYDGTCTLNYCCTTPLPTNGSGNITNGPLFVDQPAGNLRLQSNSPCINAGSNSYITNTTDLDGSPRIVGGTVDIGAYEFQAPVSQISYVWLQQYGLPINAATDAADPDGDAVDNYHEWLAHSDPTNPLSSPAQLTITLSETNLLVTWPTNAVGFTLLSAPSLTPPVVWSTNASPPVVIGQQNVVTNPVSGSQQFYRLVQ